TTLGPQLRLAGLLAEEAVLDLASRLGPVLERTLTFEQFDHAERTLVGPRLRGVLAELDRAQGGEAAWPPFRQRYVAAVGDYLNELRSLARRKGRARLDELEQSLTAHPQLGPLFSRSAGRPWLERALDLLWSSPGVGLVALGMRSAAQVQAGQRAWQAPTA
ncbi:MAG TPA: hypothetical protein VLC09_21915, partial [Polyangiaceae bacterium]|nr:hypothetical protein [Polyangiaceae bacterium]